MNFKTTILLFVALAVVGGVLWYSQLGANKAPEQIAEQTAPGQGQKLIDLQSDQVKGLTIADANGNHTTLEKNGTGWRMTEPVTAAAVDWQTQDFIQTLCDLRSQGKPESAPSDSGLDKPRYSIALSTNDGKTMRLDIGTKTGVGDVMYARVNDGDVNLIDSSLAKTLKTAADDLRDKHLLTANSMDVRQIRITTPDQNLLMNKDGEKWTILEPVRMPGDSDAISSLISTITGTEASEFVKKDSDELAFARFDHPTMRIWLSTQPPSTQPTTQPADGQVLTIGAPDSLSKEHYFVQTSDGMDAKIAGSALDTFKKAPLDLRDKDVATILPDDVTRISLVKEVYPPSPTTQATHPTAARPDATQVVLLARRPREAPQPLGPAAPAKLKSGGARPTTEPATEVSPPATQPARSAWIFTMPAQKDQAVDDSKVDTLLAKFNPLRADKYLEKAPDSPVQERYIISLQAKGQMYHVEIIRPAGGQTAYANYNDLTFEVPAPMLEALDADFHKTGP
jgi:hypothetical protein